MNNKKQVSMFDDYQKRSSEYSPEFPPLKKRKLEETKWNEKHRMRKNKHNSDVINTIINIQIVMLLILIKNTNEGLLALN